MFVIYFKHFEVIPLTVLQFNELYVYFVIDLLIFFLIFVYLLKSSLHPSCLHKSSYIKNHHDFCSLRAKVLFAKSVEHGDLGFDNMVNIVRVQIKVLAFCHYDLSTIASPIRDAVELII